MKCSFFAALGLAALPVAGSSSTPSKADPGNLHAATYSFIAGATQATPGSGDGREQVLSMIQDSISRNLAGRGLSKAPSGGGVFVAYLVIVGNHAVTECTDTYCGSGRDASALHDKVQDAYNRNQNPRAFKAGTQLVDIVDAKTHELLKRSYVVRPLLRTPAAEVRAGRIQEAVAAVLKDVRIACQPPATRHRPPSSHPTTNMNTLREALDNVTSAVR
jgi:hypothetical protein